jgi:hypothetical protein
MIVIFSGRLGNSKKWLELKIELPGVAGIVAFINNDIEQLIFILSSLALSEVQSTKNSRPKPFAGTRN